MADIINQCVPGMPDFGRMTWDSEGQEGGDYHSRKLYVPSDASGLTLGRGYDMKTKNAGAIHGDLVRAGVDATEAEKISKAANLKGDDAKKFITDNNLEGFEISKDSQVRLFNTTYEAEKSETKRLCTKPDVVEKYGKCDFESLNPAISEMLVDLKFRGDYSGRERAFLQKHVVANDLEEFAKAVKNRDNWTNVPKDRFDRRVQFLDAALAAQRKKKQLAQPGKLNLP